VNVRPGTGSASSCSRLTLVPSVWHHAVALMAGNTVLCGDPPFGEFGEILLSQRFLIAVHKGAQR
jgi:hypothetical protein